jgi:adenylate kinase
VNLVLLGPPGVGKGTQGRLLAERFDVPWLSSGDILRDAVREGTTLGKRVERYMRQGELVEDRLIVELMGERLRRADAQSGFILDGYPRTRGQAEALAAALDRKLSAALLLDLPDEDVVRRLAGRRTCPRCARVYHLEFDPPQRDGRCDVDDGGLLQRDDDRPETIRRRLVVYHREIEPLLRFYDDDGILHRVDGSGPPDGVSERLGTALASAGIRSRSGGDLQRLATEPEARGAHPMSDSVYRVTEVIGVSSDSWEAAAGNAVETAARTVRDLRIAEVVRQDVTIENGQVTGYRVRLNISFKYESGA